MTDARTCEDCGTPIDADKTLCKPCLAKWLRSNMSTTPSAKGEAILQKLEGQPRVEQLQAMAEKLAPMLEDSTEEIGACFVLLVCDPGKRGFLTYISNIERSDVVSLLAELEVVLAGNLDTPPGQVVPTTPATGEPS